MYREAVDGSPLRRLAPGANRFQVFHRTTGKLVWEGDASSAFEATTIAERDLQIARELLNPLLVTDATPRDMTP